MLAAMLACMGATLSQQALAITVSETTDYPNSLSFTFGTNVGTLDLGSNFVSGSLAGNCNIGDCNPASGGGDSQDSFLLDVAAGTQITSIFVTTSNVSGPAGFTASFSFRDSVPPTEIFLGSLPLGTTTGDLATAAYGPATWGTSLFGQGASAAGAFSFDFTVEYVVTAVPVPAAVWLFGSGLLGLIGISRRKK